MTLPRAGLAAYTALVVLLAIHAPSRPIAAGMAAAMLLWLTIRAVRIRDGSWTSRALVTIREHERGFALVLVSGIAPGVTAVLLAIQLAGALDDLQQIRERNEAQRYIRCVQGRPTTIVVREALRRDPGLERAARAAIARETGQPPRRELAPVSDCERTYPQGPALARRYPDVAPTQP